MFDYIYKWIDSFWDYKKVKGLSIYQYNYYEFNTLTKYHIYRTLSLLLLLVIVLILFIAKNNTYKKNIHKSNM